MTMFAKFKNNKAAVCMLVCGGLMLVLLVMQFTPFWQYGEEGESCSISSYVWFPSDHSVLEKWLGSEAEGHDLNGFVTMPILILILSAVGTVLCLLKSEKGLVALLPTACGVVGTIGYLTVPALKLGSVWIWHLLICVVLLVLGVYGLVLWGKELRG